MYCDTPVQGICLDKIQFLDILGWFGDKWYHDTPNCSPMTETVRVILKNQRTMANYNQTHRTGGVSGLLWSDFRIISKPQL